MPSNMHVNSVLNEVWEPVSTETGRVKVVVFITDGQHSRSQDPCEEVGQYVEQGINVVALHVDPNHPLEDVIGANCQYYSAIQGHQSSDVTTFPSLISSSFLQFAFQESYVEDVYTPFNGIYNLAGIIRNRKPVYQSDDLSNYVLWNGTHWVFQRWFSALTDQMSEVVGSEYTQYPPSGHNWLYSGPGEETIYRFVFIRCMVPAPTALPTVQPTESPSTTIPSVSPSQAPSLSPSKYVFDLLGHLQIAQQTLALLDSTQYITVEQAINMIDVTQRTIELTSEIMLGNASS